VEEIDLSRCNQIPDAGLSHLGDVTLWFDTVCYVQ
jgi:hypothetical protein